MAVMRRCHLCVHTRRHEGGVLQRQGPVPSGKPHGLPVRCCPLHGHLLGSQTAQHKAVAWAKSVLDEQWVELSRVDLNWTVSHASAPEAPEPHAAARASEPAMTCYSVTACGPQTKAKATHIAAHAAPASAAGRSQVACAAAPHAEAAHQQPSNIGCLPGRRTKDSIAAEDTWQADTCGSWLSPLQQLAHRQPLLQLCGLILPHWSHCVVLQMHVPQQLPA